MDYCTLACVDLFVSDLRRGASAERPRLACGVRKFTSTFRVAISDQLRTGTDQGNPTV